MLGSFKLLLFLIPLCFQQPVKHKPHHQSKHWPHPVRGNEPYIDDCIFTDKYTLQQRLQKYPFNKAVKIEAVSYPAAMSNLEAHIRIDGKPDTPVIHPPEGLIIKHNRLDRSDIRESATLSAKEISYLSRLMFNADYRTQDNWRADPETQCIFVPRNALIFYDTEGNIFDYLEICFQCEQQESQSGKIHLGVNCNQKYDLTRKFFRSLGIKYGTIDNFNH